MKSQWILKSLASAGLALSLLAPVQAAWWMDNFDAYPIGALVPNNGWTLIGSAAGPGVSSSTLTDPNRYARLGNGEAAERHLVGIGGGKVVFHTQWWLHNGANGAIELTNNVALGPTDGWSLGLAGSSNSSNATVTWVAQGTFQDIGGGPLFGGPGVVTTSGGWVDVVCFIDLVSDTAETFIDGKFLAKHPWRSDALSVLALDSVRIYGGVGAAIPPTLIDDMCVVPNLPRLFRKGYKDNFYAGVQLYNAYETATRSTALNQAFPASPWKNFDDPTGNKHLGVSWFNLPTACDVFRAQLTTKLQPSAVGSENDVLYTGLQAPTSPYMAWASTIANIPGANGVWAFPGGPARTLTMELWNMPAGNGIPAGMNLLPLLNDPAVNPGKWDLLVQDDSKVDYADLLLWRCCPWWKGTTISSVGNAALSTNGSGALVANLAQNGAGVRFDLGEVASARMTLMGGVPFKTVDATATSEVRGSLDGMGDQFIASVQSTGAGNGRIFHWNYSGLDVSGIRYRVTSPAGLTLSTGYVAGDTGNVFIGTNEPGNPCDGWVWGPDGTFYVSLDCAAYGLTNNIISIEPVDPVHEIETISSVIVSGRQDLVSLTIQQVAVGAAGDDSDPDAWMGIKEKGVQIFANGDATLNTFEHVLPASNIGSSGNDGVRLDAQGAVDWSYTLGTIGGEAGPPVGSKLTTKLTGKLDGIGNSLIGRIIQTYDANGFVLSSNYDACNAATVQVRAFLGNTEVLFQSFVPANILGRVNTTEYTDAKLLSGVSPTVRLNFPNTVQYTFEGVTRTVDCIRITPNASAHTVNGISIADVLGTNLGEFTVNQTASTRRVTGVVLPSDYRPFESLFTIEVRAPGTTTALETHTVVLDAAGVCTFDTAITGVIDLSIKGSHWLRKTINTFVSPVGLTGWSMTLINGDIDDDNEISIGDYAQLSSGYGLGLGDLGFNPESDLNGDGATDIADYAILSANYGLVGDN